MIIECACGRLETRHDTSSYRIRGLCQRCRAERLARINFLLRRYPSVFAPILRHAGKGKLVRGERNAHNTVAVGSNKAIPQGSRTVG